MEEVNTEILEDIPMLERIAMFCVLVGEEGTVKIFQNLPLQMVEQISTAITQLSAIDKDVSLAILSEFHVLTKSNAYLNAGGFEYAKDLLYKSLGKSEADGVLSKLSQMAQAQSSFSYLENVNPKQLADFIKDESPQTMAVILSHMEAGQAAELLNTLDDETRVKVTIQMATIKDVSPEIVRTMSSILEKKLESLLSQVSEVGGVKVVADVLNRMGPKSQEILKTIDGMNAKLSKEIKDNMFVFEDLVDLESADLMKILAEVDAGDLAVALKGAPEEHLDAILGAMSARAKGRFEEEYEMLGKVKVKDVEAAQRKMLDEAQKLIESGAIERDMDE
ncbi:MAG TPA: flagellar motor switch protein FliG [Arcobacter sp.]|nr:flagellar motor switch protein FliG [Arcobacter sp.]HIP55936.1 flagellar motor switch protein FliG [Arcobacter sp.]